MADNKKYYYMRLKENFFDSEEIKVLEAMPNGYKYSIILLKLYLKSLKSDGELRLNEYIPYNVDMIAAITGHDVDTIRVAMDIFRKLKLVEILDNGTIYMLGIQSYIGKASTEADRVRGYRKKIETEKQKLGSPEKSNVVQNQYKCTPEIELEIEKEIELEKEEKRDNKKTGSSNSNKEVYRTFEECGFGTLNKMLIEMIDADIEIYTCDWVIEAMKEAVRQGKYKYSYVEGILRHWKTDGKEKKHGATKQDKNSTADPNREGIGIEL